LKVLVFRKLLNKDVCHCRTVPCVSESKCRICYILHVRPLWTTWTGHGQQNDLWTLCCIPRDSFWPITSYRSSIDMVVREMTVWLC